MSNLISWDCPYCHNKVSTQKGIRRSMYCDDCTERVLKGSGLTIGDAQAYWDKMPKLEVPYPEEVFKALQELPDKTPDVPFEGDDDL